MNSNDIMGIHKSIFSTDLVLTLKLQAKKIENAKRDFKNVC